MAVQIFSGQIIAVLWDFDQTLVSGYQQDSLFAKYGVDKDQFWREASSLVDYYKGQGIAISPGTAYLNLFLAYVRDGSFAEVTNGILREVGSDLPLYPGIPEFLETSKAAIEEGYGTHGIEVEHYVVSGGFRKVIEGSKVAPYVKRIWANEFIAEPAGPGYLNDPTKGSQDNSPLREVGYFLDDMTKTRAIWEINKGVGEVEGVDVNSTIAEEDRRVPLRNMIAVADGPTDIPVFSIIKRQGGRTLAVYNPGSDKHYAQVEQLHAQGRVHHFARADYSEESEARRWIMTQMEKIADLIVRDRKRLLEDRVAPPPGHAT